MNSDWNIGDPLIYARRPRPVQELPEIDPDKALGLPLTTRFSEVKTCTELERALSLAEELRGFEKDNPYLTPIDYQSTDPVVNTDRLRFVLGEMPAEDILTEYCSILEAELIIARENLHTIL